MTGLLFSRVAVVVLVMIAAAAVAVLAWLAVRRLWQAIRPHPGGHTASRHDDYAYEPDAGAFLGAPTDTIPRKEVDGTPPWERPAGFWAPTDETLAIVVEPGWDEPDTGAPGWAETSVVGLYDLLGGYAYPDGFPPQHEMPTGIQPWPEDAPPLSRVEVELFRLRLEKAASDGTVRVFEFMGGSS